MPDEAVQRVLGGGPPDAECKAIDGARPGTHVVLSYRLDHDCLATKSPIDCMDVRVAEAETVGRTPRVLAKSSALWHTKPWQGLRPCSQGPLVKPARVWLESSRVPVGRGKTAISVHVACTVECRVPDAVCSSLQESLSDAGKARVLVRDDALTWLLREGSDLRSIFDSYDLYEERWRDAWTVERTTRSFDREPDRYGFFAFGEVTMREAVEPHLVRVRPAPEEFDFSCNWDRSTRRYVCLRPGDVEP